MSLLIFELMTMSQDDTELDTILGKNVLLPEAQSTLTLIKEEQ